MLGMLAGQVPPTVVPVPLVVVPLLPLVPVVAALGSTHTPLESARPLQHWASLPAPTTRPSTAQPPVVPEVEVVVLVPEDVVPLPLVPAPPVVVWPVELEAPLVTCESTV